MADIQTTPEMTEVEMVEILKAIIRDGNNQAARIAAIKELRSIQRKAEPVAEGFAGLYEVGKPAKTRRAA